MSNIALNTGLKALLSARYVLDTIGHNISNANTPGYSRQRVDLAPGVPLAVRGLMIGTGVDSVLVERSFNQLLGRRILAQTSVMGGLSSQLTNLSEIESLFGEPGEGGLSALLDGLLILADMGQNGFVDAEANGLCLRKVVT